MNILVADDDADVRFALEHLIRKLGHEVVTCPDGQEAYQTFKSREFHVIVCDLFMPNLDGRDLCRAIHGLSGTWWARA